MASSHDDESIPIAEAAMNAARAGRLAEAHQISAAALAAGRRHPALFAAIGHCQMRLGHLHEALGSFEQAIAAAPAFAQAHFERGITLGMLNDVEGARRAYERVVALVPDHLDALTSLTLIAAQTGDGDKARQYGARVLARRPAHAPTLAALAVADIAAGEFEGGAEQLQTVLNMPGSGDDPRVEIALAAAAAAFDRSDRTAEAFSAYERLNDGRRHFHAARFEPHRAVDDVRRRIAYFRGCDSWTASSAASSGGPAAGHVFLLGFMRSGTTLVETVLAASPNVVAADEREFLAEPARTFLLSDVALDRLSEAGEDELVVWRRRYWGAVSNSGLSPAGKVFVNKMPFNSLRLPLIAKLFPEARVLLAIRDPRDVVLSCFRNHFDISSMTFEFLRLEDCARFYAAVMEFVDCCCQKLALNVLAYRYEDVIADFGATIGAICDFAGIPRTHALADFGAMAGAIDPRSPSAAQVGRGLYTQGIGQWRRYRGHMAPVLPILEEWIARFGYSAD